MLRVTEWPHDEFRVAAVLPRLADIRGSATLLVLLLALLLVVSFK